MSERPTALMISGSGRSGTTILSILLAQGETVLNVGQMRDLWAGWAEPVTCACGATLLDCPLWGAVRRAAFSDWSTPEFRAAEARMKAFFAEAAALADWTDEAAVNALTARHAGYVEDTRRLLAALREVSPARVYVDSSKSPEVALAFRATGVMDVAVLNLVRDPRAVACSWEKRGSKNIPKRMQVWRERQQRLHTWSRAASRDLRFRTLRYEAFVAAPEPAIREILDWLGESMPADLFHDPATAQVSWANQHLYPPSNETVLAEKREIVEIRAPQAWRAWKNWRTHLAALRSTFPTGPAYVLRW